ncbi:hypothetical protein [Dactylosporangium sp. NPDC005555]
MIVRAGPTPAPAAADLTIANMDFDELADAADESRTYRGVDGE